jgi:D-alanyl-lipoteichoic acid acyltransferase DltB (MBOAT superfamily)
MPWWITSGSAATPKTARKGSGGQVVGNASFEFLAFALAAAILFNLFRPLVWRQGVLLLANLSFLATFTLDYRALLPLAAFILLGYAGLLFVQREPARSVLPIVAAVLIVFVWLKRYSFIPAPLFLGFPYLTVGLSYILFRVLHLIIDRGNEEAEQRITFLRYLLYTLNFTTLVSGPIQRYPEFARDAFSAMRPRLPVRDVGNSVYRIVRGFFKTNVAGLLFSALHSNSLHQVLHTNPPDLLAAALVFVSYTLFLYCNFSGYIDIVIGLAKLLRMELPENFDRPFSSSNFIEFWSRWHITLSQWLKTYVYNPLLLTLMRHYPAPDLEMVWALFAFFFTFFLVGVWHGQTSSFLFFGVLQGAGVSGNKLYQIWMTKRLGRKRYRALAAHPLYTALARGLTFTWFTFTLLWFWSNWEQIGALRAALGVPEILAAWALIFAASTVTLAAWEASRSALLSLYWQGSPFLFSRYWKTAWLTILVAVSLSVAVLSNTAAPDIVYKAF